MKRQVQQSAFFCINEPFFLYFSVVKPRREISLLGKFANKKKTRKSTR
jgi:hypothetical protein